MPAPTTSFAFDVDDLLAPISAEDPSGESLRYDELYDTLKELRREEDPNLPQGVWQREVKKADWNRVQSLAIEALESRTKDLQIAAWLLEAWIHLHGFGGFETGLRLILRLCEDFWDDLHPRLDEGLEFRLAPLEWAAARLVPALKTVPVTGPDTDEAVPCTWADWENALHVAHQIDVGALKPADAETQGKITQAKFLVSVSLSPSAFYRELARILARCLAAVESLEGLLAEKCGDAAPSLSDFRATLDAISRYAHRTLEERSEDDDDLGPQAGGAAGSADLDADAGAPAGARVTSRAEAYRSLSQAADYLLRTEPHSPAPYLVKRAVAWGNLSLAELLAELLEQGADVASIYKLLGIKRSDLS